MADNDRVYTVVLLPSDTQRTRSVNITARALRIGAALAVAGGLALALLLGTWWYFAAQTARIPELERQIAELEADNARVQQLAGTLERLQTEYEKVRVILGGDVLASEATTEIVPSRGESDHEEAAAATGLSPEIPTAWPLATGGFVTQMLEQARDGTHPGVDIAVAQHSYVRASGAGLVTEAGFDSIYGLALSGNTGRSTAPHLHFEILQDGRPIDPFTLVQQRTGS
jgi:murein DD-endopeptidase MepM/ murein hydrolase activator NlpD